MYFFVANLFNNRLLVMIFYWDSIRDVCLREEYRCGQLNQNDTH